MNSQTSLQAIAFITRGLLLLAFLQSSVSTTPSLFAQQESKSNESQSNESKVEDSQTQEMIHLSDKQIEMAVEYLLSKQAADGGWHSEYYGALKGGAATTSLTLFACSHLSDECITRHRQHWIAARDFLLPVAREQGFISTAEGPDYSNYATSMLLISSERLKLEIEQELADRLYAYLVEAQLTERQGYAAEEIDFGGWDLMGWARSPRKSAGTNVSVSSFAMQALAARDDQLSQAALRRAGDWLATCRSSDGGYFFHPLKSHDGNKAGWKDNESRLQPTPYGTATADGLNCLSALAVDKQDPDFIATSQWITKHWQAADVPGFEHEQTQLGWKSGLRFYHLFAVSRTLQSLPEAVQRKIGTDILRELAKCQQHDGSWQNENARMREDDPLICTCFCLTALLHARKSLQGK
jgi:hypothetical protein